MNILGISAFYHDSAACLLKDGRIIAAAQEERFTRKKHDSAFPVNAINYCLKEAAAGADDIDLVSFYKRPFLESNSIINAAAAYVPYFSKKFIFPGHYESHASSAFFPSPFQEAAFLTIDGMGESVAASYGVGRDNIIKIQSEPRFTNSLGLLYSAFTYYTGFKVNSAEYKVMGLAPYGEPSYKDLILNELIDLNEDGSFSLNMEYFDYCMGFGMINKKFETLFGGPPREPESELRKRDMDIASSIQDVTEEIVLRMAKHVHKVTRKKYLCLGGGVALNCVSNGRILRDGPFEDIWIQPASGDAGAAVGAALFTWYQHLHNKREADGRHDFMHGSYLGPEFKNDEIENFLKKENIPYTTLSIDKIPGRAADLINEQKVIGWFQGRMEFGPRALGARSIIGDARSPMMQEKMNLKIKFRESFRPFAPAVLKERASDYFEIDRESPYMLLTAPVKENIRKSPVSAIPAVTHIDYSARIQTVGPEEGGLFYKLLKEMDSKYDCPIIINTSFNVRGEPIVCTPEDAYRCFMRANIDCLIMGNFLIEKVMQRQPTVSLNKTGGSVYSEVGAAI